MSSYRFAKIPSNGSVAAVVTLAVSAWLTVAAGTMLADPSIVSSEGPRHAVLLEEAAPASPAALPVVAVAPHARERVVVEARRLAAVPEVCERIVVEAQRIRA